MPNHVHLLTTPGVGIAQADEIVERHHSQAGQRDIGLTGKPFWQEESYDHLVRHEREFGKIRRYIEGNPVRAGLVKEACEYRWSSAGMGDDPEGTPGRPRTRGSAPQNSPLPSLLALRIFLVFHQVPEAAAAHVLALGKGWPAVNASGNLHTVHQ